MDDLLAARTELLHRRQALARKLRQYFSTMPNAAEHIQHALDSKFPMPAPNKRRALFARFQQLRRARLKTLGILAPPGPTTCACGNTKYLAHTYCQDCDDFRKILRARVQDRPPESQAVYMARKSREFSMVRVFPTPRRDIHKRMIQDDMGPAQENALRILEDG